MFNKGTHPVFGLEDKQEIDPAGVPGTASSMCKGPVIHSRTRQEASVASARSDGDTAARRGCGVRQGPALAGKDCFCAALAPSHPFYLVHSYSSFRPQLRVSSLKAFIALCTLSEACELTPSKKKCPVVGNKAKKVELSFIALLGQF